MDAVVIMALVSIAVTVVLSVMGFILNRLFASLTRAHERIDQLGDDIADKYVRRDGIQPTLERIEAELLRQREMHTQLMADNSKTLAEIAMVISGTAHKLPAE